MIYRNSTAPSPDKRVATRRAAEPNDPYTARKAARLAAKGRSLEMMATANQAVAAVEEPDSDTLAREVSSK